MADQRITDQKLAPSDCGIFVVTLENGRTENVGAAYLTIRTHVNEWIEFKDHNHKLVCLYAPGTVRSVGRAPTE